MGSKVDVVEISKDDSTAVVDFINGILENEFSESYHHLAADDLDDVCKSYSGNRDMFLVLKDEGEIIGSVAVKEDAKEVALLRRLFIAPEHRKKGYGKLMVQKAIEFCEKNGYEMISFRGNNQMDSAIKVMERFGFIKKDIIDFGAFHIYIYVKLL